MLATVEFGIQSPEIGNIGGKGIDCLGQVGRILCRRSSQSRFTLKLVEEVFDLTVDGVLFRFGRFGDRKKTVSLLQEKKRVDKKKTD